MNFLRHHRDDNNNIMGLMLSKNKEINDAVSNHSEATAIPEDAISIVTPVNPSSGSGGSSFGHWKHQQQNHHVRQASVRSRAAQPIPDHSELDKRFAKVLVS